ncbi:MAG TPA: histidine kinase [Gemmatimonadaceae bacterium]
MRTIPRWLVVLGVWTAFGLVESAKGYLSGAARGRPGSWMDALVGNMPWWWTWALLTPLVAWLAARVRLDDERTRWRALAAHATASLLVALTHLLVVGAIYQATVIRFVDPSELGRPTTLAATLAAWTNFFLVLELFTYWGIVGAWYALDYRRRYRESALLSAALETRAAQLQTRIAEARVEALRMELNPHFLFNTLNAISGLVRLRETDAAVRMLARLGDLLRATIDRGAGPETTLEEELALLDLYLDIERVRFGERLEVRVDVQHEARAALVPTLILQPLVENAVRHGIARTPGPGLIEITARRENGALHLAVRDNGAGLPDEAEARSDGVGLSNTRARLEELYGAGAGVELVGAAGGGVRAVVRLPYHREPLGAGPVPAAQSAVPGARSMRRS